MRPSDRSFARAALVAFTWVLGVCTAAGGVEFAGGTGEPNDPYQITTAEQLVSIRTEAALLHKSYVLMTSLDLSGMAFSQTVIGTLYGTFDGNGKTVRNLRIEGEYPGALFGHVASGGEVKSLGLVNVQIVGGSYSGALVETNRGRVANCYSTGAIIGTSYGVGGLVGDNRHIVTDCYSTAAVIGATVAGGLVGYNRGTVSSCYATGEVTARSSAGGLVGRNAAEITDSYARGSVAGESGSVGGLAGDNSGVITASYATGMVVSQGLYVGGLAGMNSGKISSCYATGSVTGAGFVGGLAGGSLGGTGEITASYCRGAVTGDWYVGALLGFGSADFVTSSYFLDLVDVDVPDNEIGTPLTSAQMLQQASFAGFDFWGTAEDGDSDLWYMPRAAFPVLAWQVGATGLVPIPDVSGMSLEEAVAALEAAGLVVGEIRYDFHQSIAAGYVVHAEPYSIAEPGTTVDLVVSAEGEYDWAENTGDGTPENPYQIQTAGQLESLGDHPELWESHFVLSNDVDLIGRTYEAALIAPDADRSKSGFQGLSFDGTLDGQDHVIRNLTIRSGTIQRYDYVGLFGLIGPAGTVENLALEDASVQGISGKMSNVGILAGASEGSVTNCSATGVISGGTGGDALVGVNNGTMTDCRSDVTRIH